MLPKRLGAKAVARTGPPDGAAIETMLGRGWVGDEALAIGLACALTADTGSAAGIAAALWRSAAHSSDSTASIAGNLLGAMVGTRRLPRRWLSPPDLRSIIERPGADFYAALIREKRLTPHRYPPN